MDAILEVQGLTKKYKKSDFRLNNVSFSLPSGAIMGLIGENGSGKTTTIGCILNTLIKDGGTVKVFGKEMSDKSADIRNDIGVVFDANNFSDDLTAVKISSVMRRIYSDWDNNLFNEYLNKFNLPAKNKIKTFSRGMTMKLGIAVALSHQPKLLILDEATSGLDPIFRDEILDVFLDFVQDESHSILLSSHITTDLEKIADYITFIHNGNVLFTEKKDELIYNYGVIRCKSAQFAEIDRHDIIAYRKQDYQIDVLVADKQTAERKYRDFIIDNVSIENIMLMLIKGEKLNYEKE
ncbi:MAG: ABC transporter ATP-binding protein [Oscillospiraceae bacterium]|nr:ABC transporter ATP-binding protein [Oscillospiraceae bacterium]